MENQIKKQNKMEDLTKKNLELIKSINGKTTEKMVEIINSINNKEKNVITDDMLKIINSINGK